MLKDERFGAKFLTSIADQYATTSMAELNESISHIGLQLDYTGNSNNAGLVFIHSIRPERMDDNAILLFDKTKQFGYTIYIMPKIAYKYTIYNKVGQVTATIVHSAGLDSVIAQFKGSEIFYKLEGEIL